MIRHQVTALTSLVVLAGLMPASALAQEAGASASPALDEIVVTAERREQRLQDVPIAVTAFSQATLQSRQINNVVDIMSTIPNLHASNNIGQGTATTAFIRGVGETESIITIDAPVGFYLDDVYIGRQGVNNMALFDVERIEVLRGPQGTLYGRNTSAGAIKVITKKPEFELGGAAEASYGRFDTRSAKGSLNVPLSDAAAFRFNVLAAGGGGNFRNVTPGNVQRVNDHKMFGVRAGFRALLSDKLEINIAGDFSRDNQNGRYGIDVAGVIRPASSSLFVSNSGRDAENIGKAYGFNATVDYAASDAVSLKSITAYRVTKQKYALELSDQPVTVYSLYTQNKNTQFSQEFQLSGSFMDDRLNIVAGLYAFDENGDSYIGDEINLYLGQLPGGIDLRVPLPFFAKNIGVDATSYAAFTQINFAVTEQLGLILGGRFTKDKKSIDIAQFVGGTVGFGGTNGAPGFNNATVCGAPNAQVPGRTIDCELKNSRFTPKFGLEFKPNDDVLLFATYTKGYKAGGWSARVNNPLEFLDFDPETINSYELGVKSTVLGGQGTVNVSAFYYDYKNLFNTGTTNLGAFGVTTSDAKIWGIEVETNWRLAEGVRLFANGAWQDNKRKSISVDTIGVGPRLQRTPEWSFATGVNVERPLTDSIDGVFNADYSYMDEHFVSPQNFPVSETGPIDLVNASAGIRTGGGKYEVLVGCKNCFNEKYFDQALPFGQAPGFNFDVVYPGMQRTWSITARVTF